MKKINSVGFGIVSGILLPFVLYLVLYYTKVNNVRYTLTSDYAILSSILPVLISHCILPNMILFFIFNWTNKMLSAKGVVIATVILAAMVFITKLIFTIL